MIEKAEGEAMRIEDMVKAVGQGNLMGADADVDMGVQEEKVEAVARRIKDAVRVVGEATLMEVGFEEKQVEVVKAVGQLILM